MNAHAPHRHRCTAPAGRQRGVVLFVALIVMVAMSLAAIALVRSLDTSTQVIGNLAFRQAAITISNQAIEQAAADLFPSQNPAHIQVVPDIRFNSLAQNYYATHDPTWDDASGVPAPLQTGAAVAAAGLGRKKLDAAGNTVTYVTERMCNPDPTLTNPQRPDGSDPTWPKDSTKIGWCDVINPKGGGCHEENFMCNKDILPVAYYRVTVRVDGPKNTVAFVQTMLKPGG